jgi:hypothetical protein
VHVRQATLRGRWRVTNRLDALRTALASAFASADFTPFLPLALPIDRTMATYENRFVSPDSSLAVGDASSRDGRNAFTLMMFPVLDLNLPYLVVARKGDVDISTVTNGQPVQLESIDFDDRFAVRANDGRSAVMLIDQGMCSGYLIATTSISRLGVVWCLRS